MIRVKKAFTLIELIIVIILTSSVYLLMFSNSNFLIKDRTNSFSFITIKDFLIKNYAFTHEISLICIEDNFDCFIKIDGTVDNKSKIEKVFNTKPEVYEYSNHQIRVDFESVKINDIDKEVVFEFKIDKDFKSKDYILDTLEDKVYVFNSISLETKKFLSLDEAFEVFNTNILEVKDAF